MSRQRAPVNGPLDDLLRGLRVHRIPYRCDAEKINRWQAGCPHCLAPFPRLEMVEHGHRGAVSARCAWGCTEAQILAALAKEPAHAQVYEVERELRQVEGRLEVMTSVARAALDLARDAHGEVAELQRLLDIGLAA